jgi:hypothetical protein
MGGKNSFFDRDLAGFSGDLARFTWVMGTETGRRGIFLIGALMSQ